MSKFKVGDLVRWYDISIRLGRPHLGIVVEDLHWRCKVQWFTDNNRVDTHPVTALMKVEDRGHEI